MSPSSVRRTVVRLTAALALTLASLANDPALTQIEELCTTDLHCAEMHGFDLNGNPYPPKEN